MQDRNNFHNIHIFDSSNFLIQSGQLLLTYTGVEVGEIVGFLGAAGFFDGAFEGSIVG